MFSGGSFRSDFFPPPPAYDIARVRGGPMWDKAQLSSFQIPLPFFFFSYLVEIQASSPLKSLSSFCLAWTVFLDAIQGLGNEQKAFGQMLFVQLVERCVLLSLSPCSFLFSFLLCAGLVAVCSSPWSLWSSVACWFTRYDSASSGTNGMFGRWSEWEEGSSMGRFEHCRPCESNCFLLAWYYLARWVCVRSLPSECLSLYRFCPLAPKWMPLLVA